MECKFPFEVKRRDTNSFIKFIFRKANFLLTEWMKTSHETSFQANSLQMVICGIRMLIKFTFSCKRLYQTTSSFIISSMWLHFASFNTLSSHFRILMGVSRSQCRRKMNQSSEFVLYGLLVSAIVLQFHKHCFPCSVGSTTYKPDAH